MARNSRIKKHKVQVLFDEKARSEYLLGFRKRKEERKKKGKEILEEKIKQEKKRQKEMKIEALMKQRKKAGLLGVLEEVVSKKVEHIEMKDHTVIISDIDTLNKMPTIDDSESEHDDTDKQKSKPTNGMTKNTKRKLNEKITRLEKHLHGSQGIPGSKRTKKSKQVKNCNKASKKFYIKDKKSKKKADRKLKKKIIKYGERE